jgi:16S rRNA (guanine527-N7)-methyltransferase
MNKSTEILINKAKEFNLSLSEQQIEQFEKYQEFLFEYNSHTNLVSSAEPELVALKHFADSISINLLADKLDLNSEKTLLDIGIGGGFPGVPIIIAYPKLKLCAVDSVGKKTEFIRQLAEHLEISDRVEVKNIRAEELDQRESFDIAASRAVDRLNVLLEYTLPYLKVGGYFIAYKAKTYKEEIAEAKTALNILGGQVIDIVHYTLFEEENLQRNLILIKKIKPTPEKYPRKTGIPHKKPLL